MLYGLTSAAAIFQNLVNDGDKLKKFVFVDNVLKFSQTETEHIHLVRAVLQRLHQNQLFVKAKKVWC